LILGCVVTAAYFAAAYWLKVHYDRVVIKPNVAGKIVELRRPFVGGFGDSKFAVVVPDYWFTNVADSVDDGQSSTIVVYEDDKPLVRSTTHQDIATKGMGRFSHWRQAAYSVFLFSSSDNTDPRTNGRSYYAVKPEGVSPKEPASPAPTAK
jgi:hypothetical protein